MNAIEESYITRFSVDQQLPNKCFLLFDDVTFDLSEEESPLITDFIEDCVNGDCWAIASITQSNQIFIIHNILNQGEDVRDEADFLCEDILTLLRSGRKIMLVLYAGDKVFYIQKKAGIEINEHSTFDDVNLEAKSSITWMAINDRCDPMIEQFPECSNITERLENLNKRDLLPNIQRMIDGKKVRAILVKYPRPERRERELPLRIQHNTIPLIIPNNPRPELYTPEAFTFDASFDPDLIGENLIFKHDFDTRYRHGDMYIYTNAEGENPPEGGGFKMIKISHTSISNIGVIIYTLEFYSQ